MSRRSPSLREKQKQQTRAEIVRAAFELFGRHGYDDVPMETISEAVGVSRATLFNYFPQKELILREIASSRVEKLKAIVTRFSESGKKVSFSDIVGLFVEMAEENARITGPSRRLFLSLLFQQAAHGSMMASRQEALLVLRNVIERIPGRKAANAKLVAETMFAIYIATMMEWFIREEEPAAWLLDKMRARLTLALEGMA